MIDIIFLLFLSIYFVHQMYGKIKEDYSNNDPMIKILRQLLLPVHPVFKHLKIYRGDKSYTINKDKIYVCVVDENGEYYPLNQLVYVVLHEVAHYLNKLDIGHTKEWRRVFTNLLNVAEEKGIYNPDIPVMSNYCEY